MTNTQIFTRLAGALAVFVAVFGTFTVASPAMAYYGAVPGNTTLSQVCDGRYDPNCILKETAYENQLSAPYTWNQNQNWSNNYNATSYVSPATPEYPSAYTPVTYYPSTYYPSTSYSYVNYPSTYSYQYSYQYEYPTTSYSVQPYTYSYNNDNYNYDTSYSNNNGYDDSCGTDSYYCGY
jgi:hypothetical protein